MIGSEYSSSGGIYLNVCPHQHELLDIFPRPNKVFGHYFDCVHLPLLGHLLYVRNDLLLLLLHLCPFPVQLPHSLVESALVLSQHLIRGHLATKQPIHLRRKYIMVRFWITLVIGPQCLRKRAVNNS